MPVSHVDPELLQAALLGYQHQLSQIEAKIAEIRSALGGRRFVPPSESVVIPKGQTRILSPEARQRIADAQKKRWQAYNKAKSATKTSVPEKVGSKRPAPARSKKGPAAKRGRKSAVKAAAAHKPSRNAPAAQPAEAAESAEA